KRIHGTSSVSPRNSVSTMTSASLNPSSETEFQDGRRSQTEFGNERTTRDLTTFRLRVAPLLLFKCLSPRADFKHLKLGRGLPLIFLMIIFCGPESHGWQNLSHDRLIEPAGSCQFRFSCFRRF